MNNPLIPSVAIVAVADHGHFGRAASSLHVSLPTLGMQLCKLDDQFGVRLVDRSHATAHLTAVEREVPSRACKRLFDIRDVEDIIRRSVGEPIGTIRFDPRQKNAASKLNERYYALSEGSR
ncbi:LysR family transcriptional regulator [Sphingobium sp. BS19]|uniref:LysR family transcriptional regulator n=1 Tax=Sphingobium sp. BS19 TaxID=3018973 RepID=UPI0035CE8D09